MSASSKKHTLFKIISLVLLSLSGIFLIGLQDQMGYLCLGFGIISLFWCKKDFARDILLIYISLFILSLSQINTDISYLHMVQMWLALWLAVALPYIISKYVYKDQQVVFQFFNGRRWSNKEIIYIFVAAIIAYFLIPFYLTNTGAYLNWSVEPWVSHITRLFIWTNALGIWDELFFISVVLGLLRRWMPFVWANLIQATLFTSFLYELWFTSWGFIMVYIFAIIQGIIFKKTESLAYVITIHLVVDFILFLALIQAHHPDWIPIFVT